MSRPTPPLQGAPAPEPLPTPVRGRAVVATVAAGALVLVGLGWWLRPSSGPGEGPLTLAGKPLAGSPFVGSRSCRECHPGESAAHSRSGHATTLRPASAAAVAHRVVGRERDDPEHRGVRWHYRLDGGGLVAERRAGREVERFVLDYALGSGKHAVTFASLVRDGEGPPSGVEHRLTYFARAGTPST